MSRQSSNHYINGKLINGFDYDIQVWVVNTIVQRCGHPDSMGDCCNKKKYAGLNIQEARKLELTQEVK